MSLPAASRTCYPLVKLRAESAYLIPTKRQSTTPGTCSNCVRTTPGPCVSALVYADRKRHDEVRRRHAAAAEPTHPSHFAVLAHVHRRRRSPRRGTNTFREGIRQFPDHELAIFELIHSRGLREKKAACGSLRGGYMPARTRRDGLLAYFAQGSRVLQTIG